MIFSTKTAFFTIVTMALIASVSLELIAQEQSTEAYLQDFIESCGNQRNVKAKGDKLALIYYVSYDESIKLFLGGTTLLGIGTLFYFLSHTQRRRDYEALIWSIISLSIGGTAIALGVVDVVHNTNVQGKPYILFDPQGLIVKNKRVLKWAEVKELAINELFADGKDRSAKAIYKDRQDKILLELDEKCLPVMIEDVVAISRHYMNKIQATAHS